MKRVVIVGCAGAGKSTLAKKISNQTGLRIVHLDQLYWLPNWIPRDRQSFNALINEQVGHDSWIMDGNYKGTLAERLVKADLVIVLNTSRWRCLWRIFLRTLKSYNRTRQDMPDGCLERFDWEFTKYIWTFSKQYHPLLQDILLGFNGQIIELKNPRETQMFLKQLENQPQGPS